MRTISVVSNRTHDFSAVEKVVELACSYSKNSLEIVMKTVEYAAKLSRNETRADMVKNVADALLQESVKSLSARSYGTVLLEGVANIAYTGDKTLVNDIAVAFQDESVLRVASRYTGKELAERLTVLIETAVCNGNPEDIKKIAMKW